MSTEDIMVACKLSSTTFGIALRHLANMAVATLIRGQDAELCSLRALLRLLGLSVDKGSRGHQDCIVQGLVRSLTGADAQGRHAVLQTLEGLKHLATPIACRLANLLGQGVEVEQKVRRLACLALKHIVDHRTVSIPHAQQIAKQIANGLHDKDNRKQVICQLLDSVAMLQAPPSGGASDEEDGNDSDNTEDTAESDGDNSESEMPLRRQAALRRVSYNVDLLLNNLSELLCPFAFEIAEFLLPHEFDGKTIPRHVRVQAVKTLGGLGPSGAPFAEQILKACDSLPLSEDVTSSPAISIPDDLLSCADLDFLLEAHLALAKLSIHLGPFTEMIMKFLLPESGWGSGLSSETRQRCCPFAGAVAATTLVRLEMQGAPHVGRLISAWYICRVLRCESETWGSVLPLEFADDRVSLRSARVFFSRMAGDLEHELHTLGKYCRPFALQIAKYLKEEDYATRCMAIDLIGELGEQGAAFAGDIIDACARCERGLDFLDAEHASSALERLAGWKCYDSNCLADSRKVRRVEGATNHLEPFACDIASRLTHSSLLVRRLAIEALGCLGLHGAPFAGKIIEACVLVTPPQDDPEMYLENIEKHRAVKATVRAGLDALKRLQDHLGPFVEDVANYLSHRDRRVCALAVDVIGSLKTYGACSAMRIFEICIQETEEDERGTDHTKRKEQNKHADDDERSLGLGSLAGIALRSLQNINEHLGQLYGIHVVVECLTHHNLGLRPIAREIVERLRTHGQEDHTFEEIGKHLDRFAEHVAKFMTDPNTEFKWHAAELLGGLGLHAVPFAALLLDICARPEREQESKKGEVFSSIGGRPISLVALLNGQLKSSASKALKNLGMHLWPLVEDIAVYLTHGDRHLRSLAVKLLGKLGRHGAPFVGRILDAYAEGAKRWQEKERDAALRRSLFGGWKARRTMSDGKPMGMLYARGLGVAAAEAIERLGDNLRPFTSEIAERLTHSEPFIRLLALGALVAAKDVPSFEESIVKLRRGDVDRGVRGAAAVALRGELPWGPWYEFRMSFFDDKKPPPLLECNFEEALDELAVQGENALVAADCIRKGSDDAQAEKHIV